MTRGKCPAALCKLRIDLRLGSCGKLPRFLVLLLAGFLGFYSGMRAKIVQSILAAALLMAIKEELTASMRKALQTPVLIQSPVR